MQSNDFYDGERFIMLTQSCIILAIVVYLCGMLYIGISFSKKNSNTDDFYLGGRTLGPFVTAMSAEASDMSSYLLMGLPGLAYLSGLADVGWTVIGLAAGTYLNWLIVSRKIRRYSHAVGAITIPDFFAKRYGDRKYADRHCRCYHYYFLYPLYRIRLFCLR